MDNRLLVNRNILCLNFNAQIAARNLTPPQLQNRFQIVEASWFSTSRDLDRRLAISIRILRIARTSSARLTNEAAMKSTSFRSKADIRIVFFRNKRHRQLHVRHVAPLRVLIVPEFSTRQVSSCPSVFQNRQAAFAIVDQNVIASLHVLKQFRAGDVETLVRSFDFRSGDLDDIAL